MKYKFLFCILLVTNPVFSQTEIHVPSIESCRLLSDSNERLKCYDSIGNGTPQLHTTTQGEPQKQKNVNLPKSMPVLLSDIEEPRIFSSLGRLDFLDNSINSILLGVGTRLKMKSFSIDESDSTVDFNFITLIKSQFDVDQIDTRNNRGGALINTDFMLGGELVKPFDSGYLRLRYTHKSTHLGDEFLIDNPEYLKQRLNLSYETVDLLAYRSINNWGGYFGGSAIVRSEPGNLDKFQFQAGVQYKGDKGQWFTPVFGLDLKSWQASNWHVNTSIKAGLEYSGYLDQPLQFMLEYYDGKSPYGQFFTEDLTFLGFSVNHFWQ